MNWPLVRLVNNGDFVAIQCKGVATELTFSLNSEGYSVGIQFIMVAIELTYSESSE